jgi:hypothetical protein
MTDDDSVLWRVKYAAQEVSIPRTTIDSAIERGELDCYYTACGLPLVLIEDVREWKDKFGERGRGRPRKEKT